MSAKNVRRGLFDDQSAKPLTPKERQKNKQEYDKQQKEKQSPKPIIPCDTDTDCMRKNGGDGGY